MLGTQSEGPRRTVAQSFFRAVRKALRKFEAERTHSENVDEARWELQARVSYDDLDKVWVSECLDLPGCMSQGDTEEEAIENLIDAIGGVMMVRMQSHLPATLRSPSSPAGSKSRTIALCV